MIAKCVRTNSLYLALVAAAARLSCCLCQLQAGVYDFGQGRQGEKRGSWTPGEWLAAILLAMTILLGLALALGLCYYVNKRHRQGQPPASRARPNYRWQQNLDISLGQPTSSFGSKFVGLPKASGPASTQLPIDRYDNNNNNQTSQGRSPRTPNDSLIVQI